jgi:cholesterol transport system auxiliary component
VSALFTARAIATRALVRGCALGCVLVLGACALGPSAELDPVSYDFGPGPKSTNASGADAKPAEVKFRQPLLVPEVAAPAWMDTPAIFYRLTYRDPARPQAYSASRWVMPPAILLTNRLRQRVAQVSTAGVLTPSDGVRAPYTLRLEIEDFSQVFDSETRSRGVLRLRASLLGSRALIAQKEFEFAVAAARPDAEGAVRALTAAAEQAVDQVVDWAAEHVK